MGANASIIGFFTIYFMPITRFSVLPDERGLIIGKDTQGIFQKGVVYEVSELMGEILFRPIGKYALPATGNPSECSATGTILQYGLHIITEEEYQEVYLPTVIGGSDDD